jgi:metallo-beta-lactamase superfamily protein
MSVNSVIVRMYRQLLGDCFLIIVENDGKYSKTLIDCGILQGTPGGDVRMQSVAENVYRDFGKKLDLVVVTHEHWDHISGFQYASKIFGSSKHKFKKLWMAWTEDPADPDGQALQERFSKAHVKLAALAMVTGRPLRAESSKVGLMGFSGPLPAAKTEGAKRGSAAIYENLRKWAKAGTHYLAPGMIETVPGDLKSYVLAPPRNQKLLFKALPSRGDAKETYLGARVSDEELEEAQAQSPFSPRYRWRTYKQIKSARRKDSPEKWARDRYFGTGSEDIDRRIDDRYDMEFNRLAIRMDSNTNNSSLVLAIELPDGSTMIFAADAQVGNWLSWGGVEFKEGPTGQEKVTKAHDLLARARLYKVGHHGSHNATLKKEGLELMIRDDLVALISTDAKFALEQGKGWLMPNPNVSAALNKHAPGRVVRGDKLTSADQAALANIVREGSDGLYVDVLAFGNWPADYQQQTAAT